MAGRPSMGKTAFSMNIGEIRGGRIRPAGRGVLDGNAGHAAGDAYAGLGRPARPAPHAHRQALTDEDWPQLTHAMQKMSEAQIFIDETGGAEPDGIARARAAAVARSAASSGLIIIDYLQLMQGSATGENRATEISEISRSLKSLAKELDVPVIALSQLNRGARAAPEQAAGDVGPARIGRHRAGRRRDPLHLSRRSLQPGQPGQGHRGNHHRQAA